MTVLVTGGTGQLGRAFAQVWPEAKILGRSDLDLESPAFEITNKVLDKSPDLLINCAAYTKVDQAEAEEDLAVRCNGQAVWAIAEGCLQADARLVQVSTDYVFSGRPANSCGWTLADEPAPKGAYGRSKLEGEQAALDYSYGTVVRTSWLFGDGANFVRTMRRLCREREVVEVVDDQIGRPTFASDLADAVKAIVQLPSAGPRIWQVQNSGPAISWAEFAEAIFDQLGSNCAVKRISSEEYASRVRSSGKPYAERPEYSVFDLAPLKTKGITIRPWLEALAQYLGPRPLAD